MSRIISCCAEGCAREAVVRVQLGRSTRIFDYCADHGLERVRRYEAAYPLAGWRISRRKEVV